LLAFTTDMPGRDRCWHPRVRLASSPSLPIAGPCDRRPHGRSPPVTSRPLRGMPRPPAKWWLAKRRRRSYQQS